MTFPTTPCGSNCGWLSVLFALSSCVPALAAEPSLSIGTESVPLVGYSELRTNLPGGRHANVRTMRAAVVKADGTGRHLLAEELAKEPDTWTQFAGWSPDGKTAIIGVGWQSPDERQVGRGEQAVPHGRR